MAEESDYKSYLNWDHLGGDETFFKAHVDFGFLTVWGQAAGLITYNLSGITVTWNESSVATISWDETIVLQSPVTGISVTVAPGSVQAEEGDILAIEGQPRFPIIGGAGTLISVRPDTDAAKKASLIFFATIRGGSLYLRPAAAEKAGGDSFGSPEVVELDTHHMAVLQGGSTTYNFTNFKNIYGFKFHNNPGPLNHTSNKGYGRVQATMAARPGMGPGTKFRFRVFCVWEDTSWSGGFSGLDISNANLIMECQPRIAEHNAITDLNNDQPVVTTATTQYTFPDNPRRSEGVVFVYPWSNEFSIDGLNEEMLIAFEFADVDAPQPAFPWMYHGYRFLISYVI